MSDADESLTAAPRKQIEALRQNGDDDDWADGYNAALDAVLAIPPVSGDEPGLRATVSAAAMSMDQWLGSSGVPSPDDRVAIRNWMNGLRRALASTDRNLR